MKDGHGVKQSLPGFEESSLMKLVPNLWYKWDLRVSKRCALPRNLLNTGWIDSEMKSSGDSAVTGRPKSYARLIVLCNGGVKRSGDGAQPGSIKGCNNEVACQLRGLTGFPLAKASSESFEDVARVSEQVMMLSMTW